MFVRELYSVFEMEQTAHQMVAQGNALYEFGDAVWHAIRNVIASSALLAGFGVLIELVDQIRWNTRPKE